MGKVTGFLEYAGEGTRYRPAHERVQDWNQVQLDPPVEQVRDQAARCMDCGIPFCVSGCPLGNVIPDWNDLLYREKAEDALVRLHSTNNFPEFTGLVCPAPCEAACVLGINDDPVAINRIKKIDTLPERIVHLLVALRFRVLLAPGHGAEAAGRHIYARPAQFAEIHGTLPSD